MIRRVRWIAPALASAVVLVAGALIAQGDLDRSVQRLSLWVGADAGVLWIVGLALCAAGFLTAVARDALLLAVIAVAWVSPVFGSWVGNAGVPTGAAPAVAVLGVPALWQLLLDATASAGRVRRVAVGAVWIATGMSALVLVLLRDPFLDIRCRGACGPNGLLLTAVPQLVAVAHAVVDAVAVLTALAAVVWSVAHLIRRRGISALAPAPALAVSGILSASWWLPLADGVSAGRILEPMMAAALGILAAVRIALGIATLLRRAALRQVAEDLSAGTEDDLRVRLASALGIGDVDVLYPLEDGRWADASGASRERPTGADVAEVRREGTPIALVVGVDGRGADLDVIGAAASLAIDNERLRAGISAHLIDVRRSRLRVVEAGDDERRRIERNLHDGMQQTLLILQYELGLAVSRESDPARRASLDRIRGEAHRVVERLREIAHGVFPAALDDLGVEAALQRLADDAPFPLEVSGSSEPRPPRPLERTVYLVATESIAAGPRGTVMRIDLARADDTLAVRTHGAVTAPSSSLRDRIDALGGRIIGREDGVEVELPCEWS